MKNCPNCNAVLDDGAAFCTSCGANLNEAAPQPQAAPQPMAPPPVAPVYAPAPVFSDPYDHTAEFDPRDISDNKVFAMSVYILGVIGIIIALLASHDSRYVGFHLRQSMKFTVISVLTTIVTALFFWTLIVPAVAGIFITVLGVIKIICFFQVCKGQAKEPAIIRSLQFLK